jgi:pilus assembly protein Flp/PilA
MIKKFAQFFKEEDGATAVEYGLMVALIAVAVIVAAGALGTATSDTFDTVAAEMPATP